MNAVIGTAGHVDHGKSSLIQALTGIHPSHLPQELLREMTIDLGFAHFSTPSGEKIGIIDVPGHERFIRNMVSAVWGLDMVLFVVAADEGWAALSEEHLRIIAAMGIRNCILVLSKSDLVNAERLSEVENDALEHFLSTMDVLPDVVHISAHTGQGIDTLKQLIIEKVAQINKREDLNAQAHMYVDRVFSVNGVGTTVTGTLRGEAVKEGDVLTMFPGGQSVKVRSLQGYHEQLELAPPYSRTAIGLKQISKKQVNRGSCLVADAKAVTMSTDWIVQLNPQFCILKKQSVIEVALGTAHTRARCFVYAEGQLARLQLEEPVPAFWGQSILLIQHGGSQIIGAGRLVWTQALDRKMRQILQDTLLKVVIKSADMTAKVTLELALNSYAQQVDGVSIPDKIESLGNWWIREENLQHLHEESDQYMNNAINALSAEELARSTGYPVSLIEALVAKECASGRWQKIEGGGIVSTLARQNGILPADQQQLLDEIQEAGSLGYDASKSPIVGVRRLLRALTEKNLIVPTEDNLFFTITIYDEVVQCLMIGRNAKDIFNVSDARERTGLSRKQLIPLFNRLERDGWVKRVGNDREVCRVYTNNE